MKSFTWEYVNGSLSVEYDVFWGHSDFGRNITQNEWECTGGLNYIVCNCFRSWIEVELTATVIYIW